MHCGASTKRAVWPHSCFPSASCLNRGSASRLALCIHRVRLLLSHMDSMELMCMNPWVAGLDEYLLKTKEADLNSDVGMALKAELKVCSAYAVLRMPFLGSHAGQLVGVAKPCRVAGCSCKETEATSPWWAPVSQKQLTERSLRPAAAAAVA